MFKKIAIHVREKIENPELFFAILREAQKFANAVFLTEETAEYVKEKFPKVDFQEKYDFFVILGGDGSVLNIAHRLKNIETPILPISAGTFGFLAEIPPKDFARCCRKIAKNAYTRDRRSLLDITHISKTGQKKQFRALNEAVVSQKTVARMVSLQMLVDGEYLTTHRADGVIIATPTGSTAYSLAAGGPIVYPSLEAMIMTPISPHSFSHRCLVLPSHKKITLMADDTNREPIMLTIDGQIAIPMTDGDSIEITTAKEKLVFLRMPEEHFLKTIRRKLHWGKSTL